MIILFTQKCDILPKMGTASVSAGAVGETLFRNSQKECFPLSQKGQARWFGGLGPGHSFMFPPLWLKRIRMTAIAIPYTSFGFALAADGRQQWMHNPTRDRLTRDAESDRVQKIFGIERPNAAFAYTVSGDIASRDRSFDLSIEVGTQAKQLQTAIFFTARSFVEALSQRLVNAIATAMSERRIEDYPQSEITLAGYFGCGPHLVNIQFERYGEGFRHRVIFHDLRPGACFLTGSHLIAKLVSEGDARFAQFCVPLDENPSLQAATDFAIGYIRASSSTLARGLDPECDKIGGHIHAATIIPPERSLRSRIQKWMGRSVPRSSFQWIVPPILS